VTGGAGYIGSHAALRLLKDSFRVTIVVLLRDFVLPFLPRIWCCCSAIYGMLVPIWFLQDNLSRGNMGAIKVLQNLFPEPGRLQFIYADLGDPKAVS
jgi:UDP-arabinose 4-epimerase